MDLKEYLYNNFPELILKPSIYRQWHTGIHFDLGLGMSPYKSGTYKLNQDLFNNVYDQALCIFNELFTEEDEIFLVTNVYKYKSSKPKNKRIKVYDRGIKNKGLNFQIRQESLPYVFDEEDADDYYTSRFTIKCRKKDINYLRIIKAACNEDFPLSPKFGGNFGSYYPDVFFINTSRDIIFFIYDDRGCEVISSNIETIRPLYEKYKNWMDENYREEIDKRFKS